VVGKDIAVKKYVVRLSAEGRNARHDYEYERNGVANLFMVFAPLEG
jgi:hypothetical protein